jgi:hypothetical protein
MASVYVSDQFRGDILAAVHNLGTGTYKAILLGTGYTPDPSHKFVSDVSAQEISGTGYASGYAGAGRKTISSPTVTIDTTNHYAYFTYTVATWTGINAGTIRYIGIWKPNTSDADSKIICIKQLDQDVVTTGVDFTYTVPATGEFQL